MIDPHANISSNVVRFTNILEGFRQHRIGHLVYASSSNHGRMLRDFTYIDDIAAGVLHSLGLARFIDWYRGYYNG